MLDFENFVSQINLQLIFILIEFPIVHLANTNRSIDYFAIFQLVVNDIFKSGAIDIVYMMYKVNRLDFFFL